MKTKLTEEEYRQHIKALNEVLADPEIHQRIEQLRQERSRTEGREVLFDELAAEIFAIGLKLYSEEQKGLQ